MAARHAYNHQYEYQTRAAARQQTQAKAASPRGKVYRTVILWTLMLAAAGFFLLSRHAEVDYTHRELRRVTEQLNAAEHTNQHLQRQIDRAVDLPALELRAIEEFGMRRVERHQMLDVDMNTTENVGEIISNRPDTVPIESGVLYGVPGVLIRAMQTMR